MFFAAMSSVLGGYLNVKPTGINDATCDDVRDSLTPSKALDNIGWAVSSVVRASRLHREGRAFKSHIAHHSVLFLLFRMACGDVVQPARTLPCHGRGRGFEPRRPRHSFRKPYDLELLRRAHIVRPVVCRIMHLDVRKPLGVKYQSLIESIAAAKRMRYTAYSGFRICIPIPIFMRRLHDTNHWFQSLIFFSRSANESANCAIDAA